MGTLVQKTFDGQTSGTVATATNTGASAVNAQNGGAVTFDSSMAARGTQCGLKLTATQATSAADIRYAIPANSVYEHTFIVTTPAVSGSDYILHQLWTGSVRGYSLVYTAAGNLSIYDNVNGVTAILTGATTATQYRISLAVDNTGGTAAGKFTAKAYTATGTTALGTAASTTANLASATFTETRFGATAWPSAGGVIGFDDIQWEDGDTTEIPGMTTTTTKAVHDTRPVYQIDYRGSTPAPDTITQTSGTATTPELVVAGFWTVTQSASENLVYTISGSGTTIGSTTVPPVSASSSGTEELFWDHTANSGAGGWA